MHCTLSMFCTVCSAELEHPQGHQPCVLKAGRNTIQEGSVHPATYPTSTHLLLILYILSHDIYPIIPEKPQYFEYALG